jgi:23S rRNA (uridine2552-2'-O)-methyltransferase
MTFEVKDYYFHMAKKEHYLARSVYKLKEIQKKYSIIKQGHKVLDLGSAPGSWVQYISELVGQDGLVVGVDLQDLKFKYDEQKNVYFIKKDVFELDNFDQLGISQPFDVITSDMAPKTSGIKSVDQLKSLNLIERIFELLPTFLVKNGTIVFKIFESAQSQKFIKDNKHVFKQWNYLKPNSTRSHSKEIFVTAKGYLSL